MQENNTIKSKILSGLFWKFGERITAQLVTFVVSIVLARLLSPKDYGAIALVMVFITFANVFVTSGLGTALIQKKNADNVDFSTVFYGNIFFSFLIYICIYIFAPSVAAFYGDPILAPALRVLGIRIPVAAINSVQQAYVSRNMLFKRFFWSTLFGTVVSGIVGICLAYCGMGIWALVAQYLVNTITDTVVLWFTVRWRPEKVFDVERMKVLFRYGWKLLCSGLLDTGYSQMRNLIVGKLYTSEDLAFYNKGDQYPSLLVTNINASISSVLFPAISIQQDDQMKVKTMTRRAIRISSYIMWPAMIGMAVVAEPLIEIMLTDKWLGCVPYLQISCLCYALWPVHTANLEAMKAVGRSDLFLRLEIIKKVIGLSILLCVMKHGVMLIALSAMITSVISIFINAYPNRDLLKYSYLEQIKDILPSIIMATIMGVSIWPLRYVIKDNGVLIICQILAGVMIYLLESEVVKDENKKYVIETIKGIVKNKRI